MYEDNEPWPITCPDCKHEFTEQIARLKNNTIVRCPLCKIRIEYRLEEFLGALGSDEWLELVCPENRQWHPGTYSDVPTAEKSDF
jgi:uncharacterized protein YbaR (Trm112 family)